MALGFSSTLYTRLASISDILIDDYIQTRHRLPLLTNILQFSRHVLFRQRCRIPSEMENRTLSVSSFPVRAFVEHLPAGLSSFTLFVTILGMLIASFMLAVPVIYEKYDKLARLARMMKELRVGFILTGAGTTLSLLIACVPFNSIARLQSF